jgi:hypothetical protein
MAQGTITDYSGTITVGGTSQSLLAYNPIRRYLFIQNPRAASETLAVNFTDVAAVSGATTAGESVELAPGEALEFREKDFVPVNAINIVAATTNHSFTCKEG